MALFSIFSSGPAEAQSVKEHHRRADAALQSLLLHFWNGGAQYLNHQYPDPKGLTGYWTFAHGFDAVLDGVERTNKQRYYGLIEAFFQGQDSRRWIVIHNDDHAWMCLTLLRAYDLTGEERYLRRAEFLMRDLMGEWDTTCCGDTPGGIWWDKAHTSKATAANGGPVIGAARLYKRTKNPDYLAFAKQVYDYWHKRMVNPETFQVADHINPKGEITWWRFTYNEGLMIGAGVALHEVTGDRRYLEDAHRIAGFMLRNEVTDTRYGKVLFDGTNERCGGDCHNFKGPAYRYLMELHKTDPKKEYARFLKANVEAIWNLARDPERNLFAVNWAGPPMKSVSQPQQNAAAMALNLYAMHAGPYPGSPVPANRYEAEESTLNRVALEAGHEGFTGWGYVAAWNRDGQGVEFRVSVPKAGKRTLTFRYAAGAGDASRQLSVNGKTVAENLEFPGTGAWERYRTVRFTHEFPAGVHTVALTYNEAAGSRNYLNLDHMTVGR